MTLGHDDSTTNIVMAIIIIYYHLRTVLMTAEGTPPFSGSMNTAPCDF